MLYELRKHLSLTPKRKKFKIKIIHQKLLSSIYLWVRVSMGKYIHTTPVWLFFFKKLLLFPMSIQKQYGQKIKIASIFYLLKHIMLVLHVEISYTHGIQNIVCKKLFLTNCVCWYGFLLPLSCLDLHFESENQK